MVRNTLLTALAALSLTVVGACQSSASTEEGPQPTPTPAAHVTILEPGPSAMVDLGQNVSVRTEATDQIGVGRVELWVDSSIVDTDVVPEGADANKHSSFLFWTADSPGIHTVEIKTYDSEGVLRATTTQALQVADTPVVVNQPRAQPERVSSSSSTGSSRSSRGSEPLTRHTAILGGPSIRYFRANVEQAAPGDKVTLDWEAPGAIRGFLYSVSGGDELGPPREVYPKGSTDYTILSTAEGEVTFTLSMLDNAGRQVEDSLTLPLVGTGSGRSGSGASLGSNLPGGPREWFFAYGPPELPNGPPVHSYGAQQHFDNGLMIWVDELDTIYVLYDDEAGQQWETYRDEYDDSMPALDESIQPPHGSTQPVRGFGFLWRTTPDVRERLGWSWDDEVGAPTAVQKMFSEGGEVAFLKNLYSGVYRLEPDGTWEFLPDEGSAVGSAAATGEGEGGASEGGAE